MPPKIAPLAGLKLRLLAGLAAIAVAFAVPGAVSAKPKKDPELEAARQAYDASDFAEALRRLKPLAETGNLAAQFLMGEMYFFGLGVPHNDEMAIRWYTGPAKAGNGEAAYRLGYLAATGQGERYNPTVAAHWWLSAAGRGHRASIVALADFYYEGIYRKPNETLARRWLNRAAMTGDTEEMYKLAVRLMTPEILATDYRRAYAWLYIAAKMGHPAARNFITKNQRFFAPFEVRRGTIWGKAYLDKRTPVPAPPGES
jgi:TPR repeat protein